MTVFADYVTLSAAGSFAKIPYLAGAGDYEAGWYRISAFNANVSLSPERWELFNQRAFTCPTKYANDFRVAHGVPTWRYRYMADFDNLRLYNSWGEYSNSGSYHGADMSELFGTAKDVTGQPSSAMQENVSRYMQRAWAAFGRNPEKGLEEFGWPRYDPNGETLVALAFDQTSVCKVLQPSIYDEPCPSVERHDPKPGRGAF